MEWAEGGVGGEDGVGGKGGKGWAEWCGWVGKALILLLSLTFYFKPSFPSSSACLYCLSDFCSLFPTTTWRSSCSSTRTGTGRGRGGGGRWGI